MIKADVLKELSAQANFANTSYELYIKQLNENLIKAAAKGKTSFLLDASLFNEDEIKSLEKDLKSLGFKTNEPIVRIEDRDLKRIYKIEW